MLNHNKRKGPFSQGVTKCFVLSLVVLCLGLVMGCAAKPRTWYPNSMSPQQAEELKTAYHKLELQQPY